MRVAVDVVDPADRRPVLVIAQRWQRVGSQFAAVAVRPVVGADHVDRVRGVFQRVILAIHAAFLDFPNFVANRDHRLAEAIELLFRFGFGRLDHQRASHRKRHGWRVKAVIDQAFSDVVDSDAGAVLDDARINDAFVRDQSVGACVKDREVLVESLGNVIGVQYRRRRRFRQAVATEQRDVRPADRQHAGAAEGCGGDPVDTAVSYVGGWQKRNQMRLDADRADPGTAAAVRDGEGLVQVQVRNVAAELAWRTDTDHRVHVGPVDVDLAAVLVHQFADLGDVVLEHAVRRRVGNHNRGEVVAVLLALRLQIFHVDVAGFGGADHNHFRGRT